MLVLPVWIEETLASFRRDDRQLKATDRDDFYMNLALQLGQRNVKEGGGPFAALVVDETNGHLLSAGVNRVVPNHCSLAHAEMLAIAHAQAQQKLHRLNHNGARITLFTTAQPCCMCFGALFWAGLDRLVQAARREDVESLTPFREGPVPENWVSLLREAGIEVSTDVKRQGGRDLLTYWQKENGNPY
jgi:tRNA(Arg) A34 adenosine deaminase TadA